MSPRESGIVAVLLLSTWACGFIVGGPFGAPKPTLLPEPISAPPLPASPPPAPVLIGDMRAIVNALAPYERGGRWDHAQICVRTPTRDDEFNLATGTVGIEFHPKLDTKLYGWGDDIPGAIKNLSEGSEIVLRILGPFAMPAADAAPQSGRTQAP